MSKLRYFTLLFDYDSLVYKAVYRVVSFSQIRGWFLAGHDREWMEQEIINLAINRLSNMGDAILRDIEDTGVQIGLVEYFLTACRRSKRKAQVGNYKKTRKPNRWVNLVRKKLLDMGFAQIDDEWEADDLIKDRAIELGTENVVICTMDKDLKQIPGIHFDYYRKPSKNYDEFGRLIYNDPRGLNFYTKLEAAYFFWSQMLIGDRSDNIEGIKGIGPKRAEKLLKGLKIAEMKEKVREVYREKLGDQYQAKFDENILLLGLGKNYREF